MSNAKRIKRPKPTPLMRPGAYILRVEHDDWCAFWQHKRPDDCNCEPNHTVVPLADERLN